MINQTQYRRFLTDYLNRKDVNTAGGRSPMSQKLKLVEREFVKLYDKNPKEVFATCQSDYPKGKSIKRQKETKTKTRSLVKVDYTATQWLELRKKVFTRDNNKCIKCKAKNNLRCHHTYYLLPTYHRQLRQKAKGGPHKYLHYRLYSNRMTDRDC